MNWLTKYVVNKLIKEGCSEEEAIKEANRRHAIAMEVPADFGPDWIDSPETIHRHFEEEAIQKGGTLITVEKIRYEDMPDEDEEVWGVEDISEEQLLCEFQQQQMKDALKAYPEGEQVVCCKKCGSPLRYNSISYHEGFHIDSCI